MIDAREFVARFRTDPPGPAETIEKLYNIGFWLYGQERYADAALAFRTMLRASPTDERSWLALGACHEGINQFRIALELYGTGSAVVPSSVRCQVARARVLSLLGRETEADMALDSAAQIAEEQDEADLVLLVEAEREKSCR